MTEQEFFKRLGIESSISIPLLSGYRQLDEMFHGGFSNELVTVASRPGHGKTAFLFNLMMNFSLKQEFKGIVAFPRMSQRDFIFYFNSWVINRDLFNTELTEEILEKVYSHFTLLTGKRVNVLHGVLTLDEIFTMAELKNADFIILDDYFRSYIWQYDVEKYAEDFGKIQEFIDRKNISVFVSILTSRMAEKRGGDMRPRLCDIYRSDLVSSYSHKVIQIYRPEEYGIGCRDDGAYTLGDFNLLIQQNSKGMTGSLCLYHRPPKRIVEDPNGELKSKFDSGNNRINFFF